MTYEQVNNVSCNIALGIYASIVLCAVYYLLGFWGLMILGFFIALFIGLSICLIKGMENKFLCFDNFVKFINVYRCSKMYYNANSVKYIP